MQASAPEKLKPFLTPAKAWAFALGTSIGWGSLVVTANTYLAQGGPLGSVLGLIAGALIMLVISKNYAYMMECCPEPGGAYAYCRDTFGFDQGFLCAWFLALTYLAILWANATALPLFSRYFLGDLFEFGYLYTIFDYDVYLGEALLSIAALLLVTFLCANRTVGVARLMMGLVVFFSLGILICFFGAAFSSGLAVSPAFTPDGRALSQIVRIAVISPWAFIGFESVSHRAGEFTIKDKRFFRVLAAAVGAATLLYICATLLSASAYPAEYDSWVSYIGDLGNLEGIKGLPAFYAVDHYLGRFGVTVLMLSLLALILTSLIGNIAALSRLFSPWAGTASCPKAWAN